MTRTQLFATLLAAAPGIVALAVLAAAGLLDPAPAAVAAAGVVAGTALLQRPLLRGLAAIRAAVDALAEQETAVEVRSIDPLVRDLSSALARMVRVRRKQQEHAEAELAGTRRVLDSLPEPLILLDTNRHVVRTNAAAAVLLGDRLVGRDLAAALRNPAVLAAAGAVLSGEADRTAALTSAGPPERHFAARIVRLPDPASDGAVALLVLHDTTEARRSEQMRADFVANASHELRTPLAALLGFVETLRGPAREDAAARERFLGIMQEQAMRMGRVIDDLLSLSRIELNEHVPPAGRVDLGAVLRGVAVLLEQRAQARGMRIALDLPADLPPVRGDTDELTQLFQNLLDNAVKYGRDSMPIEIAARRSPRRLAGRPAVAVSIRDQGDGIASEHIPRLTERFYRVDTARSRAVGGTGLGLAIVKHVVSRHRGALEIESELGRGSVFTVHLPSVEPA